MAIHNKTGEYGENQAAKFLISKGYQIRNTQWRYEKAEIDIIAENEDFVVFVEVKTRSSNAWGDPIESVDSVKQKRIMDAAQEYIDQFEIDKEIRFDVLSIILNDIPDINHIEEAFTPEFD